MLYPWLTPLLAAIACSALALFVLLRGPRSELGKVFFLSGAVLASFNLFYFVLYYVDDYDLAFYWARVFRVGTLLTTPVGVHLAVALRPSRSKVWDAVLALNYAAATCFIVGNIYDIYVDGLVRIAWGYTTHRTPLYEILTTYTIINALTAIALVIYQYQTAVTPRTVLQAKFWMLGVTAGISLGLTNFLPAYGVPIYPLGHFGSVAFAAILAYAIVRHRLMGVEVAVTKGIAYAAVMVVVVAPVFGLAVWMQNATFGKPSYEFSLGLLSLFILTGVAFPVAKLWVERRLEGALFQATRAGRATLASFAKDTVRIINKEQLVTQLCETVRNVFDLDRIALFVASEPHQSARVSQSLGSAPIITEVNIAHPLCSWLRSRGEPVLSSEVDSIESTSERKVVSDLLDAQSWTVCVPLIGNQGLLGFLGLGERANLKAFVQEDLEALGVLSAEASIAFDNARLYEELRRSQDTIARAGRLSALGTFAAGIAHEVRNPLVSIQTFFQLAPARLHDEEFMTSFLPLAEQELSRIRNLINELLSFARSPTAVVQEVSVREVLDRALTLLSPHAREERVSLVKRFDDSMDFVEADPEQMMQVFVNVILNGIQASLIGGQVVITVGQVERGGSRMVRVRIQDDGEGVPPELTESIFNPFFTTKDKGTGLGLSIVHRILTDCGGTITVDDGGKRGACFNIELPAFAPLCTSMPGDYGNERKAS